MYSNIQCINFKYQYNVFLVLCLFSESFVKFGSKRLHDISKKLVNYLFGIFIKKLL